jgi:hypothetical protein
MLKIYEKHNWKSLMYVLINLSRNLKNQKHFFHKSEGMYDKVTKEILINESVKTYKYPSQA